MARRFLDSGPWNRASIGVRNNRTIRLFDQETASDLATLQDGLFLVVIIPDVILDISPVSFAISSTPYQTSSVNQFQVANFALSPHTLDAVIAIVKLLNSVNFKFNTTSVSQVIVLSVDGSTNDLIYAKLRELGYRGQINDMLYDFFGPTGHSLNDRENNWLVVRTGVQFKSSTDLWGIYLKSLGYSGTLNDMIKQFWINY